MTFGTKFAYGAGAVYLIGTECWIISHPGLFLLQPGQNVALYFLAILAGLGVSTAYLVPWSMLPVDAPFNFGLFPPNYSRDASTNPVAISRTSN